MEDDEHRQDERTHEELRHELALRNWNIGKRADGTGGVTLTFRRRYTSNAPGVETRKVHGKDETDAVRKFLAELDAERTD
jgi:hypothetical protein